jgi:hypothetical protein
MIAFVSYSIGEDERFILTLLAQKMGEIGFTLSSNYKQNSKVLDFVTVSAIRNSVLVIGLITESGSKLSRTRVYKELREAFSNNKPTIILAENEVDLPNWIENYQNTVKFNRAFPEHAIEAVQKSITFSQEKPQGDNTLAWLVGGGIAALALISLLSSDKKKVSVK